MASYPRQYPGPPARGYNINPDTPHQPAHVANYKKMDVLFQPLDNNTNYSGMNVGYRPSYCGTGYVGMKMKIKSSGGFHANMNHLSG